METQVLQPIEIGHDLLFEILIGSDETDPGRSLFQDPFPGRLQDIEGNVTEVHQLQVLDVEDQASVRSFSAAPGAAPGSTRQ